MKQRRRKTDPMIDEIRKDVKEIKTLLSGNGDVGYCERVRNTENRLDEIEKKNTEDKKKPKNIVTMIQSISVIIATVIAIIALLK